MRDLDEKNNILNTVRFYPNEILDLEYIKEFLPFDIKEIGPDFISKYNIKPLYYKNGYTAYFYQDKTYPAVNEDGTFYLRYGGKGLYTLKDKDYFEGPVFNWTGGFGELVESGYEAIRFFIEPVRCETCGKLMSRFRAHEHLGNFYCETCYVKVVSENKLYECESCGDLFRGPVEETHGGHIMCPFCLQEEEYLIDEDEDF